MNKTLELSVATGGAVTIGFFLLTFASLFMVGGDGTAPWITHLMLKLGEVPITMFGVRKDSLLVVSPLFWGGDCVCQCVLSSKHHQSNPAAPPDTVSGKRSAENLVGPCGTCDGVFGLMHALRVGASPS